MIVRRYRKKPVEVEAAGPLTPDNAASIAAWCGGSVHIARDRIAIDTLEGTMIANEGDWIIRGVKGEHYPCKPDIFDATYEPTEDTTPMTTHTLSIVAHPQDGEPIVSLGGGTHFSDFLLTPADTEYSEDRAALVDAVRDLTGPRDQLPADLRDDRRIAWVPDAGDGEGAWCAPLDVRQRLISEGWILRYEDARSLFRPPVEPATEQVPWWEAIGRTHAETGRPINSMVVGGGFVALSNYGVGRLATVPLPDGTVTVLKERRPTTAPDPITP